MSSEKSKGKEQKAKLQIKKFQEEVWTHYKTYARNDLPWRLTKDPYRILVSEVMLQQTQVSRVIEKYKAFLIRFPNARRLAEAPLTDVLRMWSGLGYNRRAKYLKAAAEVIVRGYGGRVPKAAIVLQKIPGVGPYTASAVRIFAFNEPDVLIETNVRAAIIHGFFADTLNVRDRAVLVYAEKAAEGQDPRDWHWALMDYGAHIKKVHKNPARRSAHYTRQSKFEGSPRQVRGRVIRVLAHEQLTVRQLQKELEGVAEKNIEQVIAGLQKDGLIKKEKGKWRIV
ncbi:MAG TPA: A/G-specific adenine glycosylase [Candidatus Paceibacterota bacterium]